MVPYNLFSNNIFIYNILNLYKFFYQRMNIIQLRILENISLVFSIISIAIVLSIRIKLNYKYTIPESIVIGIIISDLIYEICVFCAIFIPLEQ